MSNSAVLKTVKSMFGSNVLQIGVHLSSLFHFHSRRLVWCKNDQLRHFTSQTIHTILLFGVDRIIVGFSESFDLGYKILDVWRSITHEPGYCNFSDVWMIPTASRQSGAVPTIFASHRWRGVMDTWTVMTILMSSIAVSVLQSAFFLHYGLQNTLIIEFCVSVYNLYLEHQFSRHK